MAIEYIDVLVEKVSNTLKAIDIGNNVASALIENKKMLAMSKGVELIIEGDLKGLKVPVEDTDMCVILANLLNNAVEGVLETGKEEKKVHVKIARIKQFQIIKIENECVLSELSKDSLISKKGAGHGYGLKNVRETAEKYGGVLDYYVKDGVFTATVTFDDQYAC